MLTIAKGANPDVPTLAWHTLAVGALTLAWTVMAFAKYGALGTGSGEVSGWAQAFIGASLWGSLAGSVLLLARSHWAVQGFVTALVGVMATAFHAFVLSEQPAALHEMPAIFGTWLITLTALYYATRVHALGLLR